MELTASTQQAVNLYVAQLSADKICLSDLGKMYQEFVDNPVTFKNKYLQKALKKLAMAPYGYKLLEFWFSCGKSVEDALVEIWADTGDNKSDRKQSVIGLLMMKKVDDYVGVNEDDLEVMVQKHIPQVKQPSPRLEATQISPASFIIQSSKADDIINLLQRYLEGKSPAQAQDVMRPFRAAQDAGVIRRITYMEMQVNFPAFCPRQKSSVNKYTNPGGTPYDDAAYHRMVQEFLAIK